MTRSASCSGMKAAVLGVVVPLLLVMALLPATASAAELRKKKPGCSTVASCEVDWCDRKCREWGYTDPVGAYCTYGGTITRCCCGSIGAADAAATLSPALSAGVADNHQQLVQ